MFGKELIALFIVSLVNSSWQASTPSSPYYTAGVVEFKQASGILTPAQRLNNNLAAYLEIITSPEAAETDIIVFPEATLNNAVELTFVPDPKDNIAPCNISEYASFLQKLSCQASASKKYIVVNLSEKEKCTIETQANKKDPRPCALYGLTTYNTNVVFDRNGVVVSRYRKYNLYYEPWNVTYTPEYGHFDTDFGVKFGHFICFDILFYTPTAELVNMGIKDFIFPTMWFSELPFLSAAQIQQSWAYSYDVNFLAAGASNPSSGSTGTGIYAGKSGALVSVMNNDPERKLYVARVPKKGFPKADTPPVHQLQIRKKRAPTSYLKNVLMKRDPGLDDFTSVPLNLSTEHTHLCHGNLCCHFSYKLTKLTPPSNTVSYQYRLAAFDGDRIYTGIDPLGWSVCSVLSCINGTMDGCALAFNESVSVSPAIRFEQILIEADFHKTENALLMPNSVDDELMPLTVDSFQFNVTDKGNKKNARYELLGPRDNLIQFGIYVNYFGERSLASALILPRFMIVFSSSLAFLIVSRK